MMKFELIFTTYTREQEASSWTELFEKLRVLELSALISVERIS